MRCFKRLLLCCCLCRCCLCSCAAATAAASAAATAAAAAARASAHVVVVLLLLMLLLVLLLMCCCCCCSSSDVPPLLPSAARPRVLAPRLAASLLHVKLVPSHPRRPPAPLRRSAIPVVTCVLAIAVESRYPSRQELTALLMLTFGVMLAVWQVRRALFIFEKQMLRRRRRLWVGTWQGVPWHVDAAAGVPMRAGLRTSFGRRVATPGCTCSEGRTPLFCLQGTITGKPYAIVFCLIGTVCNGAMMTFSGKVNGQAPRGRHLGARPPPAQAAMWAPPGVGMASHQSLLGVAVYLYIPEPLCCSTAGAE